MDRVTGRIVRIMVNRETRERSGYGFVQADGGEDYFLHASELDKDGPGWGELQVGARVEFTPTDGPRGLRAVEARILGE